MYNLENHYLDLMNTVLACSGWKKNRTGVPTKSIQGAVLRHVFCKDDIPVLTTKKVNFEAVKAELLWFLTGSGDCREIDLLLPEGPNIWKANAKAWNEKMRKTAAEAGGFWKAPETKCGKVYGPMWRGWDAGGEYIDQIGQAVEMIKNDPESRRILVTGWDPAFHLNNDLYACLPPCHVLHRYSVDVEDNTLSMTMYQRSADLFLGVPFNVASYALLLYMMAQVTGKKPGQIVYFLDDVHVYKNSYDQCLEQMKRKGTAFPSIKLNPEIDSINDFQMEDIVLENYNPQSYLKADMVV